MGSLLVESVGAALHAGTVQWCLAYRDWRGGRQTVGPILVEWRFEPLLGSYRTPARMAVRHFLPADRDHPTAEYAVAIDMTPLPECGRRWWFLCPKCGRRVDLLYFVPPHTHLICRTCGRLKYGSQRTRAAVPCRRTRSSRDAVLGLEQGPKRRNHHPHKP